MKNALSRRELLARGTSAAAVVLAAGMSRSFGAPGERGFKIGATDWNLGKMSAPGSFEVARQIGLDGVQVSLGTARDNMHLRRPEVQKAFLDASKAAGIPIASLAIGELNTIALKSEPVAAIWLADSIPVMTALGVKVVLVAEFANGELKGDRPGIDRTVAVLKELAPRAEKAGVILGIENYLSAEENLDILDRVQSPAVQVYYDVGNSSDKGYDIYKEIRQLKGRICEFHAKDGNRVLGRDPARVDFRKVREAMDAIDYRGWIQLETPAPRGLVPDYKEELSFLKSIFPPNV
jgi:sugar phosphate isomerase/epimerase